MIKSIASGLAFGMISDRFAGNIYQKNETKVEPHEQNRNKKPT